jgi:F0F1-type ATP synthase membrane subunit b/b'
MPDHRGAEPPESRAPDDRPRPAIGAPAIDLAAALSDLDRATRSFAERLGAQRDADLAATTAAGIPLQPAAPAAPAAPQAPSADSRDAFESKMREAEREAAEYLEHAKRRADSLVNAMVGAVEREAAEMRREAEAGIRTRWQAVEADAARHVDEARRVAERMVAERQRRIAALSDGITGRAQALTAGMDDAQRVRRQFETFVRALSKAADRIATAGDHAAPAAPAPAGDRDDDGPPAIAA